MLKPSENPVLSGNQNRYSLVIAVAKRAREIAEEAENQGTILVEKPVDLAVQEFMDHKFRIIPPEENDSETEQNAEEAS